VRNLLIRASVIVTAAALLAGTAGIATQTSIAQAAESDPFAKAEATDEPVEIVNARTETDTVYANPDGTYKREISSVPVRVQTAGAWKKVNLDLNRNADGSISPTAAAGHIRLSGGGNKDLAAISIDTTRTETSWPTELPEPVLDGPTATYPDVLDDVDLKMTVTDAGVSQVLVVHNAAAAGNPALKSLELPTHVGGGDMAGSHGGLAVTDEFGREVGGASAPIMWDSSGTVVGDDDAVISDTSQAAIDERTDGPVAGDELATVPLDVADDSITLAPTAHDLTGAGVDYPLYIDPSITPSRSAWAMVFKEHSTMEFYKWTDSNGQGVGYQNYDGVSTKRLFWKFNTSSLAGAEIRSSYFKTKLITAASCDHSDVKIYRTGTMSSSTNWGNQPSWSDYLSTESVDPCPAGKEPEWSVKAGAQYAADHSSSYLNLGLRASSETSPRNWKRFSYKATLVVAYSKYPNTPSHLKVNGVECPTKPLGRITSPPTLAATISDPDGGTVYGHFDYNPGPSVTSGYKTITTGASNSGLVHTTQRISIDPSMMENGHIKSSDWAFRVRAEDTTSLHLKSKNYALCHFSIDANLPSTPVITAPDNWPKGVPVSVQFDTGDPSDTTAYSWTLNSTVPQDANKVTATGTDKTATVPITASTVGPNTLRVWSYDAADNRSETPAVIEFEVQSIDASTRSLWTFDDAFGATTAADYLRSNDLTVDPNGWLIRGRYDGANGPVEDDALSMLGSTSPASVTGQMFETHDNSFLLSAWLDPAVAADDPGVDRTAVSYGGDVRSAVKLGITPAPDFADSGEYRYAFSVWDSSTSSYRSVQTDTPASMDSGLEHVVGWYEGSTNTLHVVDAGDESYDYPGIVDDGETAGDGFVAPPSAPTDTLKIGAASGESSPTNRWIGVVDQVSSSQGSGAGVVSRQLHSEKFGITYFCEYAGCM
jgi:hypothetical protein